MTPIVWQENPTEFLYFLSLESELYIPVRLGSKLTNFLDFPSFVLAEMTASQEIYLIMLISAPIVSTTVTGAIAWAEMLHMIDWRHHRVSAGYSYCVTVQCERQ